MVGKAGYRKVFWFLPVLYVGSVHKEAWAQ